MGLGITIGSRIQPTGLLRKKPSHETVLRSLRKAIRRYLGTHEMQHTRIDLLNERLHLHLHPAEEEVEFGFDERGLLICTARTSSAGPGYHAFLVQMLDAVDEDLGLNWIWQHDDLQLGDETGFAQTRDLDELKNNMLNHLIAIAEFLLGEGEDLGSICLSLPLYLPVVHDAYAASPRGFWDRAFFESLLEGSSDPNLLHLAGEEYFPWWQPDLDAKFWKSMGVTQLWINAPWHPVEPGFEASADHYSLALTCFDKARQLDPAITLPETEIAEVRALLSLGKTSFDYPIPPQDRIGFRRLSLRNELTGYWSAEIPGYFYETLEDDNSTIVFYYDTKAVRASSFSHDGDNPTQSVLDIQAADEVIDRIDHYGLRGTAIKRASGPDEQDEQVILCEIVTQGSVCLLTITIAYDHEQTWALEVFRSVRHNKPQEQL